MLAARMHDYNEPLVLEDIEIPEITPDQVLVRVRAAGMCRSDVQLIDGYFHAALEMKFPITPGHEIAGLVEAIGDRVPKVAGLAAGDQVVVSAGWGEGICRQCRAGNRLWCVQRFSNKKMPWEELAPLTDAGVTPYRGIKKLRAAGVLGPDRVMAVIGASGLGSYAVQYAKLLSAGATVVAFARNEEKLAIAKQRGADHVINTRGKSVRDLSDELMKLTGKRKLDAVIDCVGAKETIQTGFALLATAGAYVLVGLVGNAIDIPLFPFVAGEFSFHGSFWANYADLQEVMALAQQGKIQHTIKRVPFEDINENIDILRAGDIIGRAVILFDVDAKKPASKSVQVPVTV